MRSCLLPVACWLCAAGPILAACETVPCDFGVPGDLDADGDVDASDFVLFRQCESGTLEMPVCSSADLDRDGIIDAADFAIWQGQYTGACNCEPILKEPFHLTSLAKGAGAAGGRSVSGVPAGGPMSPDASRPTLATRYSPFTTDPRSIGSQFSSSAATEDGVSDALPDAVTSPSGLHIGDPNPMYGVHGHSGEFRLEATDLRIRGRGIDLAWTRTYRSRTRSETAAGKGWDFSYNLRIEPLGDHIRFHDGRGRTHVLLRQPDGTWSRCEIFAVLEKTSSDYTLAWADGQRWQFRPLDGSPAAGRINRVLDRSGNALAFSYDFRGRLATIHDTLDGADHTRDLTVSYNSDGYIDSITDFAGRRVTYEYYSAGSSDGSDGDLRSITSPAVMETPTGNNFPGGKTVTYTYTRGQRDERLNHNLLTVTDARGRTWLANTYAGRPDASDALLFDRVVRQRYGGPGEHIDAVYESIDPSAQNNFAEISATVNDRVGNVRVYCYDARNRLVMQRDYTGRADADLPTHFGRQENLPAQALRASDPAYFETRYNYNEDSLCTRILRPERDQERFIYDTHAPDPRRHGNLLEHLRLPGPASGDQSRLVERYEYDPQVNRVARRIDPRGNETLYGYDESGHCTRVQHPLGSSAEYFEYNAFGQLTAHVWPDGGTSPRRRDEFTYYAAGPQRGYLQTRVLDAKGLALTTSYQYDALGREIRRRGPGGLDSFCYWNVLDQIVRRASPELSPGTGARSYCDYIYDANDNIVQTVQGGWGAPPEGAGEVTAANLFEYDILNHLIRHTRRGSTGGSLAIEYAYDENRNLSLTRLGEASAGRQPANTLTILYDERDLPIRTIRAAGDPLQASSQYDYDGNRRVRRITEGIESLTPHLTAFRYDGYGRLTGRTDALGNEESRRYDEAGNLAALRIDGELSDAPGSENNVRLVETIGEYDEANRLVRQIQKFFDPQTQTTLDDGEVITRYEYSDSGLLISSTNDLGHATTYAYDALGRLVLTKDARGNTKALAYDPASNISSITETDKSDLGRPDAVFTRTFEYDGLNRLIRSARQKGAAARYTWDALGQCALITDARGHQTRYVHDGLGRLLQMIIDMDGSDPDVADPADIVISQRWDDSSRLIAQTDANLNTTVYTYDPLGRLIATRYADGSTRTAVHDVFDRPVSVTDPAGTTVRSTYDRLSRLTARAIVRGTGISGVTGEAYAYDGLSRLVEGSDDDSAITRQYNSLDHLIRETQSVGPGGSIRAVTAGFDSLGHRLTLTYPGGRQIATSYDALGRPIAIRDETPGAPALMATYSYIGPDRIERRDLGNEVRLEVGYDENRRVGSLRYSSIDSGAFILDRTYGWDDAGNRTQSQRPSAPDADNTLYFYDPANRLVQSHQAAGPLSISYTLDGVGNRTTVSGGPDAGAYLLDANAPEPADLQMNQYSAIPGQPRSYNRAGHLVTAGPTCRYSYDYRGQLTELTDLSAGLTVLFKYDVLGRRIEKNAAGIITRYFHADDQEIEEQNPSNITIATFVQPPSRFGAQGFIEAGPLQLSRGSQRSFRLADDLGSCLALVSTAGTVLEQYDYSDFGRPAFIDPAGAPLTSSLAGNAFLFRGNRYDMESGFYLIKPSIGSCAHSGIPSIKMPEMPFEVSDFRSEIPRVECGTSDESNRTIRTTGGSASLYYDPAAGRFITRMPEPPWSITSLGNTYTAWMNNPVR